MAKSYSDYRDKEKAKVVAKRYRESAKGKLSVQRNQKTEKAKVSNKRYREKIIAEGTMAKRRRKREENPAYRLKERCRARVYEALKGIVKKSEKTQDLIGCSFQELRAHIESLFTEGMNWDNWGKGEGKWELDHKLPCASFNLLLEEEQKKCFHYTNLQPLWSKHNSSKGSYHNGLRYKYSDHGN